MEIRINSEDLGNLIFEVTMKNQYRDRIDQALNVIKNSNPVDMQFVEKILKGEKI